MYMCRLSQWSDFHPCVHRNGYSVNDVHHWRLTGHLCDASDWLPTSCGDQREARVRQLDHLLAHFNGKNGGLFAG